MFNSWKGIKKPFEVIILLFLPLFIFTSALFGGEAEKKVDYKKENKSDFVLTIKENLISLKAKDAAVLEIVKEVGRRMEIEVAGDIRATETVSLEFEKLTFDEALVRLKVDYVYLADSGAGQNKIIKVTLIPKGEGDGGPMLASQSASVRTVGSASKPAGGVVTGKTTEPDSGKTADGNTHRQEPFKFEFNPSAVIEKKRR